MRRWLMLAAVVAATAIQTGCGDSVALSRRERVHNYRRGLEMDGKMLNDDIDFLLLNDRPSRLSRWRLE